MTINNENRTTKNSGSHSENFLGKKRICFFSGDITRSGGTERVACMIANGLLKKHYQVSVLSLTEQSETKEPYFPLDKRICRHALSDHWIQPGPGYAPLIPKLRQYITRQNIDVLIDIDIVLDALSVPAVFGTKIKVISWEHFNYGFETSVGYRRMILQHVTPLTDCIVTLTAGDRQSFLRSYRRCRRHYPPVCAIHNPAEGYDRQKENGGNDTAGKKKWIVTAGRLTHQKGMDYLVRTAAIVLRKYPDWQWLVLGEGEQYGIIKEQIQKRRLNGRLLLKGQVPDVGWYLKQAQIFVLTSRFEGLPMCLLEAKAQNLACVSFDIATGPDEMIRDGYNGFLVPPADCNRMAERIGRLIEDENLRLFFAANAGCGMEHFSLNTILKKWDGVLKRVCV